MLFAGGDTGGGAAFTFGGIGFLGAPDFYFGVDDGYCGEALFKRFACLLNIVSLSVNDHASSTGAVKESLFIFYMLIDSKLVRGGF